SAESHHIERHHAEPAAGLILVGDRRWTLASHRKSPRKSACRPCPTSVAQWRRWYAPECCRKSTHAGVRHRRALAPPASVRFLTLAGRPAADGHRTAGAWRDP